MPDATAAPRVAADTFRAAAIDQLRVWADRLELPVIAGQPGGDPIGSR